MFHVKSIEESVYLINKHFKEYPKQNIKVETAKAINMIISKDIYSHEDVPHFNRSTVDGYACKSSDVKLASQSSPVKLMVIGEVLMGKNFKETIKQGETAYVPTGGYLPQGSDCSVMIENTDKINNEVFIFKSASVSENVFYKGTDTSVGDLVVKKGTKITPFIIGALRSLGINQIEVYKPLSVSIISTGNELVQNRKKLEIGEIRDINTDMIKAYLTNNHLEVTKTYIINDDLSTYQNTVLEALKESDIVISSGGSSVGEEDFTIDVINNIGAELYVHGINIKPGKPTIIAKYHNKLFLGLPGQPTSAYMVLNTLFNPIINTLYNLDKITTKPSINAVLTKNVHSPSGRRLYQLITLELINDKFYATPLFKKSGMIHSLVKADGYIIIDEYKEGINEGKTVKVYRLED